MFVELLFDVFLIYKKINGREIALLGINIIKMTLPGYANILCLRIC